MLTDSQTPLSHIREVGTVASAKHYLLFLEGLPHVRPYMLLTNADGKRALTISFNAEHAIALLLDEASVAIGNQFYVERETLRLPEKKHILGRVISPLGTALDGGEAPSLSETPLNFDVVAQGIGSRAPITEQLATGVALVDTLVPIGKGQRELVIGPARSGKATFARDAIVNQAGKNIICIYASVGKSAASTRRFALDLFSHGAREYTSIVAAPAGSPTPQVIMVTDMAFGIAEDFAKNGRDVLLIVDDLAAHAKYVRELALLSGEMPGRESYPGDIFYRHAHLIERAGRFRKEAGGGSVTLLPLLETDLESMTNLIPTNAMASTDGHLFFSAERRSQGKYPAVEVGRSVTRIGRRTQFRAQKELADKIIALLALYEERKQFSRFGAELSADTKRTIAQAEIILEFLEQEMGDNRDIKAVTILLALAFTTLFIDRTVSFAQKNKQLLLDGIKSVAEEKGLFKLIEEDGDLAKVLSSLEPHRAYFESICLR